MVDFRELMGERADGLAPYKAIEFRNGTKLSVQAGNFQYSEPRQDGLDLYDYTHFEVAIIKGGEFTTRYHPEFAPLGDQVAAYVDVKTIQQAFERLEDECGGVIS